MLTATETESLVLVVDDDPWARTMTTALLSSVGYGVAEAKNGEEALRLARELSPHVILLDLALPTKSGLDVLRELKMSSATRSIPVVIVSAYAELVPEGDSSQADALVQKPFELDDLLASVERLVPLPEVARAAALH